MAQAEHRCGDCGTYTASVFRICEACVLKYRRVSGWCDKHGPKFGRCDGCKMGRPAVAVEVQS